MTISGTGDRAYSILIQTRSAQIKQDIAKLTDELGTGRISDLVDHLGGDLSYLSDIERNLTLIDGYSVVTAEAKIYADTAQVSLGQLQDLSLSLGTDLLFSTPTEAISTLEQLSLTATEQLEIAVSALNTEFAGLNLFGGTDTDSAPIADAQTILDEMLIAISGNTTVDDIFAAADSWLADPSGYDALVYQGSDTDLADLDLGSGLTVARSVRADDDVFKNLIRDVALAALATDATLGLDAQTQSALLTASGEGLLTDQDALARVGAQLGEAQARIEEATTRNEAQRSSLQIAYNDLTLADPYETAIKAEEAQFRLEALYAAMARSSRLSLVNFL